MLANKRETVARRRGNLICHTGSPLICFFQARPTIIHRGLSRRPAVAPTRTLSNGVPLLEGYIPRHGYCASAAKHMPFHPAVLPHRENHRAFLTSRLRKNGPLYILPLYSRYLRSLNTYGEVTQESCLYHSKQIGTTGCITVAVTTTAGNRQLR